MRKGDFRENAHLSLLKKKEKCILKASRHRTEDPSKKKHLQAKMIKRNEIMLRMHSGLKSGKSTI